MRWERKNQHPDDELKARVSELDPILVSPYGPAACQSRNQRSNTRQNPITLPELIQKIACISRGVHTRPVKALCRFDSDGDNVRYEIMDIMDFGNECEA